MIRFETLLEKVRSYSPEADLELLRRAYVFSALEHKGQVRHSGEPYLVHPLEVADFLADMKLDVVAVAAGLLHDVVEDTCLRRRHAAGRRQPPLRPASYPRGNRPLPAGGPGRARPNGGPAPCAPARRTHRLAGAAPDRPPGYSSALFRGAFRNES